tara:strand:+ start:399 stop:1133 length:735 start_codon:yes stop_codon:yes gene_type:complete
MDLSMKLYDLSNKIQNGLNISKHNTILFNNLILYSSEECFMTQLSFDLKEIIIANIFEDWKDIWQNRLIIMAICSKKDYKICLRLLLHDNVQNIDRFFRSYKSLYLKINFVLSTNHDVFQNAHRHKNDYLLVAKIKNQQYYLNSTDSCELGAFILFANSYACEKKQKNKMIDIAMDVARLGEIEAINVHKAKSVIDCGGKKAIPPFENYDTMSISLNSYSLNPIWFLDKQILLSYTRDEEFLIL